VFVNTFFEIFLKKFSFRQSRKNIQKSLDTYRKM